MSILYYDGSYYSQVTEYFYVTFYPSDSPKIVKVRFKLDDDYEMPPFDYMCEQLAQAMKQGIPELMKRIHKPEAHAYGPVGELEFLDRSGRVCAGISKVHVKDIDEALINRLFQKAHEISRFDLEGFSVEWFHSYMGPCLVCSKQSAKLKE